MAGYYKSGAVESPPDTSELTSKGYPTSGDPKTGTPATKPGAAWYYLQDQMRTSVIEAAGQTLAEPPSATQFLEALRSMAWLADNAIPGGKIADASITGAKLAAKTVAEGNLADLSVSTAKLAAGCVTEVKIAQGAVTFPKIAPAAIATQTQAQEGTANNVLMTPLRVAEAIAAQIPPGVPAGTVAFFAQRAVPAGWLICNGANVSRTIYASLFAAIGTAYGEGDGSTTFTLPNAHRRFLEATTTTSEVGGPIAAGVPNVTGFFGSMSHISATGAFLGSGNVDPIAGGTTGGGVIFTDFYANRSSAIYGSSSSVQPNSIRLLACIKF